MFDSCWSRSLEDKIKELNPAEMTAGAVPPEEVEGEVVTSESLEKAASQAKADHPTATTRLEKLEPEAEHRKDRQNLIPDQIVEVRGKLTDSEAAFRNGIPSDEEPERRIGLAEKELLERSPQLLEDEQGFYRGARELLELNTRSHAAIGALRKNRGRIQPEVPTTSKRIQSI